MAKLIKQTIETWYFLNTELAKTKNKKKSIGYSLATNGIIQKINGRITEHFFQEIFTNEKNEIGELAQ